MIGDAGMVMFGPIGRDILAAGTIIFAIAGTVSYSIDLMSFTLGRTISGQ